MKLLKCLVAASVCVLGVVALATAPIFACVACATCSPAYATLPFFIFDIKNILVFIFEA